jgi:hypothetical protein
MSSDDIEEAISSYDPEVDAEAIMHQIRENIRRQRVHAEAQGREHETSGEGATSASHVGTRFDNRLYEALHRMSVGYDKVGVGLLLTGSTIPLVAPLVQWIRTALHRLVVYYVNTLASQQVCFNEQVFQSVTALVEELEEDPTSVEVEALRQEVAQLRAQVERLKAITE